MNLIKYLLCFVLSFSFVSCIEKSNEETVFFAINENRKTLLTTYQNENTYLFFTIKVDNANIGDYNLQSLTKKSNKFIDEYNKVKMVKTSKKVIVLNGKNKLFFDFLSIDDAYILLTQTKILLTKFTNLWQLDYNSQLIEIDKVLSIIDTHELSLSSDILNVINSDESVFEKINQLKQWPDSQNAIKMLQLFF